MILAHTSQMDQPDVIKDAMLHAKRQRDSLLSFVKVVIGQRISLHRDSTGLNVLLLGGVITLLGINNDQKLVKTTWLLYVAGGLLVVNVVLALLSRSTLLRHLQITVARIESDLAKTSSAIKQIHLVQVEPDTAPNKSDRLAVAINKLVEAETPSPYPELNKFGEHSYRIVSGIFVLSLILIALALLVRITL